MGNRMLSVVSTFLYVLLTGRVLLVYERVPATPVRSRHSLPRFLVREDAYVCASGPAPLRGGVLTRRPIVLRTAPLSATGRFLFQIGAGALRQCSAGASGAPVLWSTPRAMSLSEDMRSPFRFSNACSLAKRCSMGVGT